MEGMHLDICGLVHVPLHFEKCLNKFLRRSGGLETIKGMHLSKVHLGRAPLFKFLLENRTLMICTGKSKYATFCTVLSCSLVCEL